MNQVNFYDSFLWSVGIVDSKFRDVCTWFQTNAMINMYNGNYKNVLIFLLFRLLHTLTSLPTMIQPLKYISVTFQCSTSETMMD